MFNPKAWSNADLMLEWIKHMYTPSKYPLFPRYLTTRSPRFLSLDVFSGQKTKEVVTSFKALKCTTSFIPGGTTGFIQVCDTVINKSLKDRIEELADQYIDEHEREWVEGKYTVSRARGSRGCCHATYIPRTQRILCRGLRLVQARPPSHIRRGGSPSRYARDGKHDPSLCRIPSRLRRRLARAPSQDHPRHPP